MVPFPATDEGVSPDDFLTNPLGQLFHCVDVFLLPLPAELLILSPY